MPKENRKKPVIESICDTEKTKPAVKPKTCNMARAALLVPLTLWILGFFLLCQPIFEDFFYLYFIAKLLGLWFILVMAPVGVTLSLIALSILKKNKGRLKGRRLAIEAIVVVTFLSIFSLWYLLQLMRYTFFLSPD